MVTKRNLGNKKNQQRLHDRKRNSVKERVLNHPEHGDINLYVATAFQGFLNGDDLFSSINKERLDQCIDKINKEIIDAYAQQKFGKCSIAKGGIEFWLHSKHRKKLMTLQEIGEYVGGKVDVNEISDYDSSRTPWATGHTVGRLVWKGLLTLVGILNSPKNSTETKIRILEDIRDNRGYTQVLIDTYADSKYKINEMFNIEPGTKLY